MSTVYRSTLKCDKLFVVDRIKHFSSRSTLPSILCLQFKNHYETLGVGENCSLDDIKKAYIEKSKIYHPDTGYKGRNQQNHFVAINEAYSILGKRILREEHDKEIAACRQRKTFYYVDGIATDAPPERVTFYDSSLWENRSDRSSFGKNVPYYGIKGIKKQSNGVIATCVIVFAVIGAIFHFSIARYQKQKRDQMSMAATRNYMEAKERARKRFED